ncbi:MAG: hypothetical protein B6I19_07110 [Bacteroidetes bacterium 4572_114]|nr:MAG: hypothetical protein B6I19_07110 [Bacteroidetes bacterium 4572_114]
MPPVDKEMLKKKRIITREYRNRKLGGFLKELNLTEGMGTGLPIIYSSLEVNGSPPPVFETDDDRYYFLSIIKVHPLTQQIGTQGAEDATKDKELPIKSLSDINIYLRLLVSKKRDKDINQVIRFLDELYHHLRLLVSQNGDKDKKQHDYLDFQALETISRWMKQSGYKRANDLLSLLKPIIEHKSIDILEFCLQARSREHIFEKIQLYNNTKNYNRHIYQYFNIPNEVYEGLISAGSHASYYYHNIRGKYEYKKI